MHNMGCIMDDRIAPSRLQVQQRRKTVARLYLQHRTQWEIAREVGVNQATVSRDLKAIQAEWQKERLEDFLQAKLRELARIDQLEREYWEAWERSCEPREVKTQEKIDRGEGGQKDSRLRAGMRTERRDGNPAFLDGVQWCLEYRAKVLGIFAPTKIAPVTPDGKKPYEMRVKNMTEEQLRAIAALRGQVVDAASAGGPVKPVENNGQ